MGTCCSPSSIRSWVQQRLWLLACLQGKESLSRGRLALSSRKGRSEFDRCEAMFPGSLKVAPQQALSSFHPWRSVCARTLRLARAPRATGGHA